MDTNLFDYHLPEECIAQHSVEPRDQAKLLIVDRANQTLKDRHVFDLSDLLDPGDLLVFNNSKVFRARLEAHRKEDGRSFEIFLLHPQEANWICLAKPARHLRIGEQLWIDDVAITVLAKNEAEGTMEVQFPFSTEAVFAFCERVGSVPIPPYVATSAAATDHYQTVYAQHLGSVAAPTAGFHFTETVFEQLKARGVQTAFVTLHVGLGTFRPMKSETLEAHLMHEEWATVSPETIALIQETKAAGKRVIAVGTTTVRALESAAANGSLQPFSGFTRLFITPGYSFRAIDGLMTNFHLPKSTLLVLVSAFAGLELIKRAYQHAIDHDYRFYSFGDAMLIV